MSDILDRLRGYADSRLYALPGQYVCDVPEILNEHAELVTRLLTAERERDEARREREVMKIDHADALDAYRQMYESERDRAERMERVVDAVRDYFNDAPNDNGLYSAWTAYTLAASNVRALDEEAQP